MKYLSSLLFVTQLFFGGIDANWLTGQGWWSRDPPGFYLVPGQKEGLQWEAWCWLVNTANLIHIRSRLCHMTNNFLIHKPTHFSIL